MRIRVPFPPLVLLTLVFSSMLLLVFVMLAPGPVKIPLLLVAGLLVMVIAFVNVELTLYLLILSTLLSPELTFGTAHGYGVSTTESRGITIRVDDILLTLVCLTWMLRMAIRKELGLVRQTPLNQPIAWYWMAALFTTLAGFYTGRVGAYGFFFVLKYLEYFLLFYMVTNHVHGIDDARRYANAMLLTCLVVSVISIAQIPTGERVSAPFEGEIGEPNTFGGYLVLMFSIVLGIFLHHHKLQARIWLACLMVLILIPLAFTESRTSYLAFAVSFAAFLYFSRNKRLVLMLALVGLAIMPFALPQNVIQRISYTFAQPEEAGQMRVGDLRLDTSTSERLRSWKTVLQKSFPQHPLLGVGVTGGQFLDAQYPRVLLESGIIGLILFLWLLRRIWRLLRQAYDTLDDPMMQGVALGTLCGFAGLLAHAVGANTFIIVRIMEPFMIVLGLLTSVWLQYEAKSASEGLQSRSVR